MSVKNELEKLKKGETILLITPSSKYFKVASEALNYFTVQKKELGIYISVVQSYNKIIQNIKNTDWSKVLFLDGSNTPSIDPQIPNRIPLQGPTALTEMGLYITKACKEAQIGFVVLDSITALIAYNDEKLSLRFLHHVVEKSRQFPMIGIVMADTKDEEKAIFSSVKGILDKVVKVSS